MKVLLAAAVVLLEAATASADVRITVDPAAPFSERELADAVGLRWIEAPRGDVVIRIGKLGADQLIVVVGDRSETVTLRDRDGAAAARVVAVVVTSMVDGASAPSGVAAAAPEPVLAAGTGAQRDEPRLSPWSVLAGVGSTVFWPKAGEHPILSGISVRAAISRALFSRARAVLSVATVRLAPDNAMAERVVPVRLGLELPYGALSFETGAEQVWSRGESCWAHTEGVYGTAKATFWLSPAVRGVIALDGSYMLRRPEDYEYPYPKCWSYASGIMRKTGAIQLGLELPL